jgi:hypothetical protein
MSMLQQLAFRQLLARYEKWQGDWTRCVYCQRDSQAEDHVLPLNVARRLPWINWPKEILLIVPCCTQCNSIAKDLLFTKLESKRLHIQHQLKLRVIQLQLEAIVYGADN